MSGISTRCMQVRFATAKMQTGSTANAALQDFCINICKLHDHRLRKKKCSSNCHNISCSLYNNYNKQTVCRRRFIFFSLFFFPSKTSDNALFQLSLILFFFLMTLSGFFFVLRNTCRSPCFRAFFLFGTRLRDYACSGGFPAI